MLISGSSTGEIRQSSEAPRATEPRNKEEPIKWTHVGLLLGLGIPFLLLAIWSCVEITLPSGEGWWWDQGMKVVLWLTAGAVVWALIRFLALWSRLGKLLQEIHRLPMVRAFERIPDEIARLFHGSLYSEHPHDRHLAAAAWALPSDEREKLAREIEANHPGLGWVFGRPASSPEPAPMDRPGKDAQTTRLEDRKSLIKWLESKASEFLLGFPAKWMTQSTNNALGNARPAEKAAEKGKTKEATGKSKETTGKAAFQKARTAQEEQFVAAFVVLYLGRYFAQLRMLALALVTAAPLLLIAAASYSFQPHRSGLNVLVALLAAIALGILYVLYKSNRDGLVSRITRTTPNRFTPDVGFFSSVTNYVLPIVVILLAQVFGVFRFILEPILGLFQ